MRHLFVLAIFIASCGTTQESSSYKDDILEHRRKINKEMLGSGSPIPEDEKASFTGLNFFPVDSSFNVSAKFEVIANGRVFDMMTNTDRRPKYRHFANILFTYGGKSYSLEAYQPAEKPGGELFIPFNDLTNGSDSYYSGRFIDIEIPEGKEFKLDFNRCYNPYCAYNENYSCPIPPQANRLELEVKAGEKKYHP
jgi:uncharacterized protein (DUF1684 family)